MQRVPARARRSCLLRAGHFAVDWVRNGEMADTALRSQQQDDVGRNAVEVYVHGLRETPVHR